MTATEPGLTGRLTAFPLPARGKDPVPAVLVLPGGAYLNHASHESEPVARWLNDLGLAAFVLRYRVAPHRHPAPLTDAVAALPHLGSLTALLGEDATTAERRAASRELAVDPHTPPVFLWHTADDEAVDVAHSLRYAEALTAAGVPVELHVLPHGRHGVGLATGDPVVSRWTGWCAEWFRAHGWR
jgi:acetyl esterase/lipase